MKTIYLYEIGETVNETLEIVEQIRCVKDNAKGYVVRSLKYPKAPTYTVRESNVKKGRGCRYTSGNAVCVGNSLYDVDWVKPYITDVEQAKTVTQKTRKKIKFKCPQCNTLKTMSAGNLINQGLNCHICSNKTSYPEKFAIEYLEMKGIKYKYQHREQSLKNRVFDFYLYDIDIYLECNGIQHYDEKSSWYETANEQDNEKRRWAKVNNKKVIELDCRYSEFEFICQKINESDLPSITESEKGVLVQNIQKRNLHDIDSVIELYKEHKSTYVVSEKTGINHKKVLSILKQSNVEFWDRVKRVKCINTGVVFDSAQEASEWCGLKHRDSVAGAARGATKSSGRHPETGEKLIWEYVNDEDFIFD